MAFLSPPLKKTSVKALSPLYLLWLRACVFSVFLMVAIGGYTRLSGSGLSIVEWRPVTGVLLPLTEKSWQEEFLKYQESPEFKQVNFDMTRDQFKSIYFVEYFHRLIGRLAGVLFFVPLFFFWSRGFFSFSDKAFYSCVAILGAAQGVMGWYMVKSGLIQDPMVSPFRLAAHLILAVLLLSLFYWKSLTVLYGQVGLFEGFSFSSNRRTLRWPRLPAMVLIFSFMTLVYGGFVAGHKAGLIYNTFPLMGGDFFPQDAWISSLGALNFYKNPALVQFVHRLLGLSTASLGTLLCVQVFIQKKTSILQKKSPSLMGALLLQGALVCQVALGILTLLFHVPINLALAHQLLGVIVFVLVLRAYYMAQK